MPSSGPRAIVSATPGGAPPPLGPRDLGVVPGGTAPPVFRQVLNLRFTAGGLAEEIAVDAAGTALRARFLANEYDALQPAAPQGPAAVRAVDGALVVELPAPRRLLSVRLAAGPSAGATLGIHRLDGQAIAEKPTVTAHADLRGAAGHARHAPSSSRTFSFDLTDSRFALRLQASGGSAVPLTAADLKGVQVRAEAAGARIGIAAPGDLESPVLVWPASKADAGRADADAGASLADALARYLARLPQPLPAAVDVALVIAADAPCQVDLQALEVPYRLVRRTLVSGEEKEVVRFPGGGAADRPVLLRLPGRARVTAATLETAPSLRGDRPVGAVGGEAAEAGGQTGVRVDGRSWVAQGLTPPRAVAATGLAVGLLALAAATELTVELREDHGGEPAGRKLAGGTLRLAAAGRRLWADLLFPAPVILSAEPCWLLLTAARGEAVWLTRPGDTPLRLLGRPGADSSALAGLETLHRLLAAETAPAAGAPAGAPELRVAGTPVPPLPGGGAVGGKTLYDLTAALNAHLATAALGPTDVELTFASAVAGSITVYPPRIEYEP